MHSLLNELATAEQSLGDALTQLRDQQAMVSQSEDARSRRSLIVLLSNALRQFYKIEEHRNALVEGIGEYLPLRPERKLPHGK